MQASRLGLCFGSLALALSCSSSKPVEEPAAEAVGSASSYVALDPEAKTRRIKAKALGTAAAESTARRTPVRMVAPAGSTSAVRGASAAAQALGQAPKPPAPQTPASTHIKPIAAIDYPAPFGGKVINTATTPGGVRAEDFVLGTGPAVKVGDEIRVHYTGWTHEGAKFDSSVDRKQPFTFPFGKGRVIKGWDEGLVGMKVGGKRRLSIPASMGYAMRAAGKIPPDSTLVFAVELIEIVAPLPDPQPTSAFVTAVRTSKTEGGTKVEVFKEGSGVAAKKGDTVSVHYTGTLDDGTEFDSSIPRKKPIELPIGVGRVIKGWDEGLVGMKVGELRKLTIPPASGYAERAAGKIPPNSTLTFTVELMRITPGPGTG